MAKGRDSIERSGEDDPRAFDSLVSRYTPLVVHVVRRMITDVEDTKDIYQEVFTKVYEALPAFRFESKMSTWIATIAYNTCINHLKKKREILLDDLRAEQGTMESALTCPSLPDEHTERADLAERLEGEILKMPVHFRTILTLYHLEDMSYGEIGKVLNLPEGTIKSHLFRARKLLRHRLAVKYSKEDLLT